MFVCQSYDHKTKWLIFFWNTVYKQFSYLKVRKQPSTHITINLHEFPISSFQLLRTKTHTYGQDQKPYPALLLCWWAW